MTDRLEAALAAEGYDVLIDDRNERVGSKFSDSDLIGLQFVLRLVKRQVKVLSKLKSRQLVTLLK